MGRKQLQQLITAGAVVVLAMAIWAAKEAAGAGGASVDSIYEEEIGGGYWGEDCDEATGQCGWMRMGGEVDEEMSSRRRMMLAALGTRYISYGALTRDRVPCSQAGRSYYNCRGSGAANPYSRGCSRITHCYRDVS